MANIPFVAPEQMTLRLKYACTEADLKEAQSLFLREHYGHGSKWRTRIVLAGFAAVTFGLAALEFFIRVDRKDRWWVLPLFCFVFICVLVAQRLGKKNKADSAVTLEITEAGLAFDGANGHSVAEWSTFKQCVESPNLFVLINQSKTVLYTIPKRAFPDEKAQDWFRSLANRGNTAGASSLAEWNSPGPFTTEGVALTVQLGYRDYLTRMYTSWRMRGIALLVLAILGGTGLYSFVHPPPTAVVPPGEVFLTMVSILTPMLVAVFFLVALISWISERKYLKTEHLALSNEGIRFASGDGKGLLAWNTYRYYLENRWAFVIWNPQGSVWMIWPKRSFASGIDMERCRELLQTHLRQSRWFFY